MELATDIKRVALYARVSTDDQADHDTDDHQRERQQREAPALTPHRH